ncbi:hypothetical protein HK101_010086 [Irineochytrium annulatum]|nr:hypothetical protein HK101_010086 [Irineochytrium annulatum]
MDLINSLFATVSGATIREANDNLNLSGLSYVVVGGTQGIGAAAAQRLASLGASVFITGRNREKGEKVLDSLRSAYEHNLNRLRNTTARLASSSLEGSADAASTTGEPARDPEYRFEPHDLSLTSECKALCDEVRDWCRDLHTHRGQPGGNSSTAGLDGLLMTAGNLNVGPRRVTKEGIQMTFALNYLSKFVIARLLTPLLMATAQPNGRARCVSILSAGNGTTVDLNDIQVEKGFSFLKQALYDSTLVDMMTDDLARHHTTTDTSPRFIHAFPGMVNTDSVSNANFPWFITWPAKIALPLLASDPRVIAEEVVFMMTDDPWVDQQGLGKAILVHPGLRVVGRVKQLEDKAAVEKVQEYSLKVAKMKE